jgi:outer membrane biosynthesis protein TonB
MDGRKLFLAVAALFVVILAAFGLATNNSGLTRDDGKVDLANADEGAQPSAADKRYQALCASSATYSRLKEVAFEEAFRIRNADPTNLDRLAADSVVRMENPVLKSRDENEDIVVCGGRLVLELRPGAERAFGGERRLTADVEYSAQAGENGAGNVFQLNGAEGIVRRLATFEMPAGQQPLPAEDVQFAEAAPPPERGVGGPEADEQVEETAATPAVRPDPAPRPTPTARPAPQPEQRVARPAPQPEQRMATRPTPRPTVRPIPRPSPTPTRTATAERTKAPPREPAKARASSNPSFNCRAGRSRSEQMVCSSSRLAAKDRSMSSVFYSALNEADPRQRRELRRTRDRFLNYRERCRDEACVAEAYDGRVEEIRDIMRDLE